MTENKIVKITNGIDSYAIECDGSIRTRISEECIKNFRDRNPLSSEYITKMVLLYECDLDNEDPNDWEFYE